ncbi:hypothetical protein MNB_SV-8-295 [hydrothermal vent metagenome]|uniref:Uncharacterized protein n=1 Tax=hydrothermal vent metagenome TaxID=652676 RepID=A0A1W1BNB8_9ZZZZ
MKIILFSLLLTIGLMAEVATTPKITICQQEKVIKNGWTDTNKTLNQAIIKLAKEEIPNIIKKLSKPLSPDANKSDIYNLPKVNLTRDDYIKLFAYSKYLEHIGKKELVLSFYIESLKGVHNIKNTSLLAAIFRLVINNIITNSMRHSLEQKKFTKKDKLYLYNKLSKLLILDNYYIVSAIQSEKKINNQQINMMKSNKDNEKYLEVYKKEFQKINTEYWDVLLNAIKMNNLSEAHKHEEQKLSKLQFWNTLKLFFLDTKITFYKKIGISLSKKDYITYAKYSALKTLLITRPKLYKTCQDYLNMIYNNKKLLKRLSEQ